MPPRRVERAGRGPGGAAVRAARPDDGERAGHGRAVGCRASPGRRAVDGYRRAGRLGARRGRSRRAPLAGRFAAPMARSSLQQHQSATGSGPPRRGQAYWNRFPLASAGSGIEECRSPDCGGAGASFDAHPRTGRTAKGRRRPARPPTGRAGGGLPLPAHPSPNAFSTTSSTRTAPALSSGSLPLPHLGDCTHDGQPRARTRSPRSPPGWRASQRGSRRRPRSAKPGAAGVAVVDEDRRAAGVGVQRGRHAADVPAVAGREQRQQPDRGVLGGVQRARHPRDVHPGARPGGLVEVVPDRHACAGSAAGGRAARSPAPRRPVRRRWYATTWVVTSTAPNATRTGPRSRQASTADTSTSVRRAGVGAPVRGRRRCTSATPSSRSRSSHEVGLAAVQVDRAGVHGGGRRRRRRPCRASARCPPRRRPPARARIRGCPRCPRAGPRSRARTSRRAAPQHPVGHQLVEHRPRRRCRRTRPARSASVSGSSAAAHASCGPST